MYRLILGLEFSCSEVRGVYGFYLICTVHTSGDCMGQHLCANGADSLLCRWPATLGRLTPHPKPNLPGGRASPLTPTLSLNLTSQAEVLSGS